MSPLSAVHTLQRFQNDTFSPIHTENSLFPKFPTFETFSKVFVFIGVFDRCGVDDRQKHIKANGLKKKTRFSVDGATDLRGGGANEISSAAVGNRFDPKLLCTCYL